MKLTTLAKVKSHLGIPSTDTSKDAKLQEIIDGISEYIEGQTSRKFGAQIYTLKLSGDGSDELVLPQFPIIEDGEEVAITALSMDDVDIFAEIASGDIDVDAEHGILYREAGWRQGRRNITITYAAGYMTPDESSLESGLTGAEDLPKDISLATTRIVARIYERSTAEGVASASPGSFSVSYKDSTDEELIQTIGKYARARVG